ncbi:putative PEP-binding protein [Aliiroseovarius subalbicans]|uniref:putative PEP-binding protein n=1 Tax=Aliiroseovarius subalbicans TaxID=2925840 RepID=UPI001F5A8802|nr:putative PEP-binding protein [uncultured Aliiroseovarius sp.]MCI2399318.1 pyruvate, phosphate dikinase [Aliiroseovarius subalbicans]
MQKLDDITGFTEITPTAAIEAARHGGRAKCLQRLIRLEMPVPRTVALDFDAVHGVSAGEMPDLAAMLALFGPDPLVSVRPSSEDPDWGGPGAILNIGMNDAVHAKLVDSHGDAAANALYLRFIQSYAVHVARLDPDEFEAPSAPTAAAVKAALDHYEEETDSYFPQDPEVQLAEILRSMARAWEGTTARLLREAKGAPADAGLGLVVQKMALGVGKGLCGSGVIQFVNAQTGHREVRGRYLCKSQGRDALTEAGDRDVMYLTRDDRGRSIEDVLPQNFADLKRYGDLCRTRLREEMQIEFTIENEELFILDAVRVHRSERANVRIAVTLASDGIISRQEAVLRIPPRALTELLHSHVDPDGARDAFAHGIAASPGAATGKIVFNARAAQALAAQDEDCILVRRETSPEDIRGMHAAKGILTIRGGITSHAAVIARGLGLPCVVGASDMALDKKKRRLIAADGRVFNEGDVISVDGTSGQAMAGAVELLPPELGESFQTLMTWADEFRDIGIRANADTPPDARKAVMFAAEGIGLCRTEHMFIDDDRLLAMREMIFADSPEDRRAALDRLLPMQRDDFTELFQIMQGKPVCIRLFDPPLHEFLPHGREGMRELAEALDLPLSDVERRVAGLREFNPMLGMRGVRLGLTVPEIYDMQARAIFEATIEASKSGEPVEPEIMIPLVSARREVEIVKARVDAVAAAVRIETEADFAYRLGVMVETPRAALVAGDIAHHAAFMSFGTNDLTQMTYGLSRDDAGRFMGDYVKQGVYEEDPFHMLDTEGVGELLQLGATRGRAVNPDVTLSICGEHGGNPESIRFCRDTGFDYVSCSPFRVPVARLAAAHLAIGESISEASEKAT